MKAFVNAHELKAAVNWVAGLADARAVLPLCSAVVLRVQDERLLVQSTDLASVATGSVRAEVWDTDGCLAIEARALKRYLSKVGRRKDARLSIDGNTFAVGSVEVSFTNIVEDPDDLPTIFFGWKDKGECTECIVDLDRLRLGRVAKFMSKPQEYGGRPAIESIFAEILADGRLRVVAIDGFKLARVGPKGDAIASGLILHKAAVMMSKLKGRATFALGDDYAGLSIEHSKVETTLTEGKFPDYEQIIPTAEPMVARLDTAQFREALETLATVTEEGYMKMTLGDGRAILSQESGTPCSASIPAGWGEDEFAIEFDFRLMLDALALCGKQLKLKLYSPSRPMHVDDGDVTMLIMPRHVK